MFLLNNTNYKYSNSYDGLGDHFQKALDESGKETFTKDDIIPIHTKALTDFCENFSEPAIEISVTQAQAFFDKYGIGVETGW